MEVVGLVFVVLPLAISAIKCYESSSRFLKIIKTRKLRVMRLGRALNEQKCLLAGNIDWLLTVTAAYQKYQVTDQVQLLGIAAVQKDIRSFLGDEATDAFQGAIDDVRGALEVLLGSIDNFIIKDHQVNSFQSRSIIVNLGGCLQRIDKVSIFRPCLLLS